MWGYNADVKGNPYDPVKAKAMLDAAGVKDLTLKIWAMPVSRPYMPDAKTAAQLLQADFAKVGVTATVYSVDWAEYLKTSKPVDRDGAVIIGWTGDNGDPDNFFTPNFSLCGRRWRQPCAVVRQGFRRAADQGGPDHGPGRARQALSAGSGDL